MATAGWWWAACIALTACEPARDVPSCQSVCGLRFDGDDCSGFGRAAQRALEVFSTQVPDACARLQAWVVYRVDTDDGSWTDFWGRQVAGVTWCGTRSIEIGSERWTENAFAHEVMHALECPEQNLDHTRWADWQWETIEKAQEESEPTPVVSPATDVHRGQ